MAVIAPLSTNAIAFGIPDSSEPIPLDQVTFIVRSLEISIGHSTQRNVYNSAGEVAAVAYSDRQIDLSARVFSNRAQVIPAGSRFEITHMGYHYQCVLTKSMVNVSPQEFVQHQLSLRAVNVLTTTLDAPTSMTLVSENHDSQIPFEVEPLPVNAQELLRAMLTAPVVRRRILLPKATDA